MFKAINFEYFFFVSAISWNVLPGKKKLLSYGYEMQLLKSYINKPWDKIRNEYLSTIHLIFFIP